ncbi:sensor histidine kinase [Marinospirillum celere]|uniref:sensor histidine kinase n=1 Tax=Marinospirillum celere TaxID=1122252 RepID=UPI000B28B1C3|nr:ATP-binding protein [Marinospirillum celere]
MENGEVYGVLLGTHELLNNVTFAGLSRNFTQFGKVGALYIVDGDNNLYAASGDQQRALTPVQIEDHKLLTASLQAEEPYGEVIDSKGNTWVFSKAALPFMDWTVLHLLSEDEVLAPAEQLLQRYLLMLLLMLIIACMMILLMVRYLLQPVRYAIAQLHSVVAEDETYRPFNSEVQGEIGQLMVAFDSLQEWRNQKERLADELISIVSHELRTPLTSIQGALDLLNSGGLALDREKQNELLGLAHRNSRRLASLVDDLLDMAAIKRGQLHIHSEQTALSPLLEAAAASLACSLASRQQQLLKVLPDANVLVEVDPKRLLQVMTNLINNASKFAPESSVIRLEAHCDKEFVRLEVIDQGPGIDEKDRDHIFQRFAQADASAKRQHGGSGLGLAISKELTEVMGGQLWVESAKPVGSRFCVQLPRRPRIKV